MTLASLNEIEKTYIETELLKPAWEPFVMGNILKAEGVFEPADEWLGNWAGFVWESNNDAAISFDDYENSTDVSPSYTSKTGSGFALSGRIIMSPAQLAWCRRSPYGVKKGLEEIIGQQMADFRKQIEGVICCGDASQFGDTSKPNWKSTGSSVFPGVVNGTSGTHMTTISGGVGDNVATNGYFMKTFNLAEKTWAAAGIDTKVAHVIMDLDTMQVFRDSKHASSGAYELQEVKESFPNWSIDYEDYILEKGAETTHRMVFVQPRDNMGQKKLKYKISKDLHIVPALGGGLDLKTAKFGWFVGWKGGPLVLDPKCTLRTGSLTIA